MGYLKRFILCLHIGLLLTACAPQYSGKVPPKVINGEIDLTGWDFEKDGPVKLDGDWLFTWENFVEPASWEQLQKQMVHTAQVPARFNTMDNPKEPGKTLPGLGYASYALKIKGLGSQAAGLVVTDSFSASQLYGLDRQGRLLADPTNYGQVASTASEELPKLWGSNLLQIKPLPGGLNEKQGLPSDTVVLLQLSSLNFADGGIYQAIELGNLQTMQLQLQNKDLFQVFMVGVFFIIGIYHLILYYQRRGDKPSIYFGLFCLVVGMRLLVMGVLQRSGYNNSLLSWELYVRLEYLSMPLLMLTLSAFFYSLLKTGSFRVVVKVTYILGLPLLLIAVAISPELFPKFLIAFQIYLAVLILCAFIWLISYSLKGQVIAQASLVSVVVVSLGTLNDILHANGLISTFFLGPYTGIAFVLLQSGIISYNNARAYQQAEYLSEKLGEEVKLQTKKLNRVQFLSQQIQNTSDVENMKVSLKSILKSEYQIDGFLFYVISKISDELVPYSMDYLEEVPKEIISETLSHSISLKHPLSMHGAVIRKGKPFFLRKIGTMEQEPIEYANTKLLDMSSVFVIPLKMDNVVFATLTFADTKYQQEERIKFLKKEERLELDLLSQYISPALYQALQKEEIRQAKDELEKAQAAVSRAKNEAAINQLAAHLAHEVNNPLNYIATGKTMQSDSFDKYHDMILGVLTSEDKDSLAFKGELEKLQEKFQRGLKQTDEGQDRIAKVIAEIRAITGVDGLNFSVFDIVPVINEELIYSLHRNKIQISEQAIKVTGTEKPIHVFSNTHITARAIRTIISNCIHFAREHKGFDGELYIDCTVNGDILVIGVGNNSFSIKNTDLNDLFDLEKGKAYGTEQIGLAMIKELLHKINCDLLLADHGRDSGRVNFQLRIPLEQAS